MEHARKDSPESAKRAANAILERMRALGLDMKLGQAYEALAASAGYRNWATMKASLECPDKPAVASAETQANAEIGPEKAMRLAASCGYVPVVWIDVEAEAERIRGLADDGSGRTVSTETVRNLAIEFARGRMGDDRMYGDFFDDWLWETHDSEDLLSEQGAPSPA